MSATQADLPLATGQADPQFPQLAGVGQADVFQLEDQVEASGPLEDPGDHLPLHRRFHHPGHLVPADAIKGEIIGPRDDLQLIHGFLRFDHRRGQSGDVPDRGLHLPGKAPQGVQVVAKDLDGDLRLHA